MPGRRTTKTRVGPFLLVALPVLLLGLVFAGVGLAIWSQSQPYAEGVLTTGTVVGHERSNSSDGTTWASVVEFETVSGEEVTFVGSTFSSSRQPLGSEVRVSYQLSNPQGARNLDDAGRVLGLIFVGVGSIVAMGTVITMFIFAMKRLRARIDDQVLQQARQSSPRTAPSPDSPNSTGWDSSGTDFISGEDRGF